MRFILRVCVSMDLFLCRFREEWRHSLPPQQYGALYERLYVVTLEILELSGEKLIVATIWNLLPANEDIAHEDSFNQLKEVVDDLRKTIVFRNDKKNHSW